MFKRHKAQRRHETKYMETTDVDVFHCIVYLCEVVDFELCDVYRDCYCVLLGYLLKEWPAAKNVCNVQWMMW